MKKEKTLSQLALFLGVIAVLAGWSIDVFKYEATILKPINQNNIFLYISLLTIVGSLGLAFAGFIAIVSVRVKFNTVIKFFAYQISFLFASLVTLLHHVLYWV